MESLQEIVNLASKRGFEARIRDAAYALLRVRFDDKVIAYTVVFGPPENDSAIANYDKSGLIKFLCDFFKKELVDDKQSKQKEQEQILELISKKSDATADADITFEENKAAMIELINRTEKALQENKIDTDKGLKIIADLRVKLNDKFGAAEKSQDQFIIVAPKFNHICEQTHKECWLQTKEFAMKQWHLIPDPNFKQ